MHPNISSEMGRSRIAGFHRQADRDRLGRSATHALRAQSQSRRSMAPVAALGIFRRLATMLRVRGGETT
jgi:hypothetical protein